MKSYIYSLMTDKRKGAFAAAMKGCLSMIAFFYGQAVVVARYLRGLEAKSLSCKVISIGNLTLGGTGKTPATCMLAKLLQGDGRRLSVLIRGYGNDEWKMLKAQLSGVPVIVEKDRIASGKRAVYCYGADTVILDDGFQHWVLKRDLDIVLIDSTNPFGNEKLFPRGILRERIKALRRADIFLLTKTDMGAERIKKIRDLLQNTVAGTPILESVHEPLWLYDIYEHKKLNLDTIKGKKILALSSIANAEYFEYTVKNLNAEIISRIHYSDHYDYKKSDLEYIVEKCKALNIDTIVTTEKDAVKIKNVRMTVYDVDILALRIALKVTDGEEVLKERLSSLYNA